MNGDDMNKHQDVAQISGKHSFSEREREGTRALVPKVLLFSYSLASNFGNLIKFLFIGSIS